MIKTITIITPSLNQGKYIEQTIKSVLSQEGNFIIDYIISDGGSTDKSLEIIKKYDKLLKEKKYQIKCKGIKYRWWSEKDRGQSHAINKGFEKAEGEILAWINSDDYYEPYTLKNIIEKYSNNPNLDLIYGDGYILDDKSQTKTLSSKKAGNLKSLLEGKYYVFQPSAFFSKKIIDNIGTLDETLHYAMDYDLWIRIFKNGQTLYIEKPLSNFRIWDNSKSVSQQKKFIKDRKIIFKKYGGNIIDPENIYKIRNKIPLMNYLSKNECKLYKFFKKIFYIIINKIKYKSE